MAAGIGTFHVKGFVPTAAQSLVLEDVSGQPVTVFACLYENSLTATATSGAGDVPSNVTVEYGEPRRKGLLLIVR